MLTIEILLPAAMKEQGEEDAGHGVIRNREAASEFVAKVSHSDGKPILFLPSHTSPNGTYNR